MTKPLPHYRMLLSESEIETRVHSIAAKVTEWIRSPSVDDRDVIAAPVLRGALYFAADLTRALGETVELHPIRAVTYSSNLTQLGGNDLIVDIFGMQPAGRRILLIDDICDSGRTIQLLVDKLLALGARQVKSVVLVHRKLPLREATPDYSAFDYDGDEWLVGYGLEDNERFRNLRGVYAISRPA